MTAVFRPLDLDLEDAPVIEAITALRLELAHVSHPPRAPQQGVTRSGELRRSVQRELRDPSECDKLPRQQAVWPAGLLLGHEARPETRESGSQVFFYVRIPQRKDL